MSERAARLGEFGFAGDDHVVPFDVDALDVRGRAVQVGTMLDRILARHDYPEPVARLLAEVVVLTILLGSSLKFDGKFIVQTRSEGPVDMLVTDFSTPGSVRAYARFDEERLNEAVARGENAPEQLLGEGVLALTIDQGQYMQRYQGVVQLDGSTLEDVARTYFRQSEQIPTEVRLGVAKMVVPGENGNEERWRAGGILLQFLPASPERSRMTDLPGGDGDEDDINGGHPEDNAWQEALMLLGTVEADELLDPMVGTERLLYRLFHEQGVRVYDGTNVVEECSCSREKIKAILDGFTAEEIEESTKDATISVSCEFCSTEYVFDPNEFEK
ncbi:Hsp33 family molecular chaperone [Chelativorans sp. YIM 93263]|uniref:Hsp33 family molecular chaperone n=1 Tax=Chelativorans sp. YIM 93263 TaxID=2906648 RepID=UPI002379A8F5|nr:Hsp33 family molecular chaperone [Chelativorans sp. YIM 93263]